MMELINVEPKTVEIPGAPKIEGLRCRTFAGPADFPAMLRVLRASKMTDQIEDADSLESISSQYAHLENCNPYEDAVMVEVGGEMVAYTRCTFRFEDFTGNTIYESWGFILPEWRRKGLGRALMHHNHRHLSQIAAGHACQGKKYFETFLKTTEIGAVTLAEQEGYTPARHAYSMLRQDLENLPDYPLPEGLEVRPALPEHIRPIWDASQEAFQDHWGYCHEGEEIYQQWQAWPYFKPEYWQVAWDGDQVAGMVLNFINTAENEQYNRRRGYTENIAVRRPWRKRGLARALIVRSLAMLKDVGMTEAALGVDTENTSGALRVYEDCGFRPISTFINFRLEMI